MRLHSHLQELLTDCLNKMNFENSDLVPTIERPKEKKHGDYSTNLPLQMAKTMGRKPRDIANEMVRLIQKSELIEKVEIAGAGFINFFVRSEAKQKVVEVVLHEGNEYGKSVFGRDQKVQIEFVSANPTGPLHVGHGRGAAYGSSLSNIMNFVGYDVNNEYYVNDAGRQIDILTISVWLRYLELLNEEINFPPNGYLGAYIAEAATTIREREGERFFCSKFFHGIKRELNKENDNDRRLDFIISQAKKKLGSKYFYIRDFSLNIQLESCQIDLADFGVSYDSFFSEKQLFDKGEVESAVNQLTDRGYVYELNGAKWFRATKFGDEKDRVLQRENGQYTYFASDVAYHINKFQRKFGRIINIWGADHHGYVPRLKAALKALDKEEGRLDIVLVQFAALFRNKEKVAMSTRTGEFVSLRELFEEVGVDAARFFYVLRKSDQHLEFDLELAKKQSTDNPVYYVQYAHARCCSLIAKWGGKENDLDLSAIRSLDFELELEAMQKLEDFKECLESVATNYSPHLLAVYLRELASLLHRYYNAVPILSADKKLRHGRLALMFAFRQVLRNGLFLLGVSAPERM